MKKSSDSASRLTNWGNSLLNKLPAITRRRRKRDASKRRRENNAKAIRKDLEDS